ncbi:MAG TPA: YkgJ family cysteine cluster protein, partial [Fuerstia sp.]|nr:YkgJ family cysteine cluster protein [Fuerstiella sp.]
MYPRITIAKSNVNPLPIVQSCDSCSACCMMTPIPPFQPGEEVARDVPDELLRPIRERIAADRQFELLPCLWLDTEQQRCLHYELRPEACR